MCVYIYIYTHTNVYMSTTLSSVSTHSNHACMSVCMQADNVSAYICTCAYVHHLFQCLQHMGVLP